MQTLSTIDAHVSGEAVRLLVDGAPTIGGATMEGKRTWMREHADGLRRSLMLEPRGHAGMHGALLTEPVSRGAHAGLLFMHAGGFPAFSGEGVIAAVTIAIEHHLIQAASGNLLLDTPAGPVSATPQHANGRVSRVSVTGVPSFVVAAGTPVRLGTRVARVDIAFGGELYAIADGESVGVPVDAAHAPQLVRAGIEIRDALKGAHDIQGTIFTGPARGSSDLRSATVLYGEQSQVGGGVFKRAPGLAGTCALMAVLDAMGLLAGDQPFAHEGVFGTRLDARVSRRQASSEGESATVTSAVEGSAFITGRHAFQIDDKDALEAFAISRSAYLPGSVEAR